MAKQDELAVAVLSNLFDQWLHEHQELDAFVQALSDWANHDARRQTPHFAEAANRLRGLEARLREHFERENAIGELLTKSRGISTPEIEAVRRQSDKDHVQLLQRLEKLIDTMESAKGGEEGWHAAIYEFCLLIDLLEQHEELEEENVRRLMPSPNLH